ncbi:hypothetical protein D3C73_1210090 [compost metagenome]
MRLALSFLATPPPPFSNSPSASSIPIFSIGLISKISTLSFLLSELFSTAFFPACAPAAADDELSPARAPAIPADRLASMLMVCFSASLSSLTRLSGYITSIIAFAASSPVTAPAAPAAALFPCIAAAAPPSIACAISAASSLNPES